LNPSIGFSTVKKCFDCDVDVVVDNDDVIASNNLLLSTKVNSNNNDRLIVNSRYLLGWNDILFFILLKTKQVNEKEGEQEGTEYSCYLYMV
jgi:hypothetical protein